MHISTIKQDTKLVKNQFDTSYCSNSEKQITRKILKITLGNNGYILYIFIMKYFIY